MNINFNNNYLYQEYNNNYENVDFNCFANYEDIVIDNDNLSIPEQNKQIYLAIKHLNNIPDIIV